MEELLGRVESEKEEIIRVLGQTEQDKREAESQLQRVISRNTFLAMKIAMKGSAAEREELADEQERL